MPKTVTRLKKNVPINFMQNLQAFYEKFTEILCETFQNFMRNLPKFYAKNTKISCKIYQHFMQHLSKFY